MRSTRHIASFVHSRQPHYHFVTTRSQVRWNIKRCQLNRISSPNASHKPHLAPLLNLFYNPGRSQAPSEKAPVLRSTKGYTSESMAMGHAQVTTFESGAVACCTVTSFLFLDTLVYDTLKLNSQLVRHSSLFCLAKIVSYTTDRKLVSWQGIMRPRSLNM